MVLLKNQESFLQNLSRHPIYFSAFFPSLVAVNHDSESRQFFSSTNSQGLHQSLSVCVTRLFWKDRPHSRTWGRRRGVAQDIDDHEDDPYETGHVRWILNVVAQGRAVRVVRARCDRSGVNWATCESGRQLVRATSLFNSWRSYQPFAAGLRRRHSHYHSNLERFNSYSRVSVCPDMWNFLKTF